jgi:hypothetical protein
MAYSAVFIAQSAGIHCPLGANPNRLPENLNSPY